jgi:hypothetical protein
LALIGQRFVELQPVFVIGHPVALIEGFFSRMFVHCNESLSPIEGPYRYSHVPTIEPLTSKKTQRLSFVERNTQLWM